MVELVPYQNGMSLGQGYNTFIQRRRVDEAVIVTEVKPPSTGFVKTYMSEEVETYEYLPPTNLLNFVSLDATFDLVEIMKHNMSN